MMGSTGVLFEGGNTHDYDATTHDQDFSTVTVYYKTNLNFQGSQVGYGGNYTDYDKPEENATEVHHGFKLDEDFPYHTLGFTAFCAFFIACIGTFGNLLTIVALPMDKKLRTTATAFVVNLAVAELLFCVFILPMSGAQYAYLQQNGQALLSDRDCIFFATMRYTITQAELQTILAIAFTRVLAVTCTTAYRIVNKGYVIGTYIGLIWGYSFLIRLPTAIGIFGNYHFNENTMECDLNDKTSALARLVSLIIEVLIPISLILIFYAIIFIRVKMSSARVSKQSTRSAMSPPPSSTTSDPSGSSSGRKGSTSSFKSLRKKLSDGNLKPTLPRQASLLSSRRDMRVARTIFIIFLMVMVCSFPVGFVHAFDKKVTMPRRFLLLHILYWVQYCMNMVVYVLLNRQYRDAYVDCVARVLPSWGQYRGTLFAWEKASMSSHPRHQQSIRRGHEGSLPPSDSELQRAPSIGKTNTPARLTAIPEKNSNSSEAEVFLQNGEGAGKTEQPVVKKNSFIRTSPGGDSV
ncbi:protein trapped in endoderm-1-like isoform X2 [Oratosquilla oratoria]|uniref:protein trapped in endoderm-1-like isoform X2 n=1 Tax=Oratosquilla oratoria TaxID=337810 RepID=UPI003F7687A3